MPFRLATLVLNGIQTIFLYWAENFYVVNVLTLILYSSYGTLFLTIKPAMGVFHSHFLLICRLCLHYPVNRVQSMQYLNFFNNVNEGKT